MIHHYQRRNVTYAEVRKAHPDACIIRATPTDVFVFDRPEDAYYHPSAVLDEEGIRLRAADTAQFYVREARRQRHLLREARA